MKINILNKINDIVTKIELIDDNVRFKCDEYVTTFGEKFVKIKF